MLANHIDKCWTTRSRFLFQTHMLQPTHRLPAAAVISPPVQPQSYHQKPNFLHALLILLIVISLPKLPFHSRRKHRNNCFVGLNCMDNIDNICFEPIALNGHLCIHFPQRIHFSSSITQIPSSSIVIALTGQAFYKVE